MGNLDWVYKGGTTPTLNANQKIVNAYARHTPSGFRNIADGFTLNCRSGEAVQLVVPVDAEMEGDLDLIRIRGRWEDLNDAWMLGMIQILTDETGELAYGHKPGA